MDRIKRHPALTVSLLLLVAAAIVYGQIFHGEFIYDDIPAVQMNERIRSLTNVPGFFTSLEIDGQGNMDGTYRPLVLTSYAFNYFWGGAEIGGFRLVNLLLHLVNALLLFALLRQLARRLGRADAAWLAAGAALLFFLHPVQTQTVNFIWKRSDLMVAASILGGLFLAIWPRSGPGWMALRLGGCTLLTGAALASKESGVLLPLLLLLTLALLRPNPGREHTPWAAFLLTAAAAGSYLIWLFHFSHPLFAQLLPGSRPFPFGHWIYFKGVLLALQRYLSVLLIPPLATPDFIFEPRQAFFSAVLWPGWAFLSISFCTGLCWLWQRRLAGWALLWFLACLLPTTLQPLNNMYDESRLYLAWAGPAILVTIAALRLSRVSASRRLGAGLAAALFALLCLTYGGWGRARNRTWQSGLSLWADAVAKQPENGHARLFLGIALEQRGRGQAALEQYRQITARAHTLGLAHTREGAVLASLGRLSESAAALEKYRHLPGRSAQLLYQLGIVYELQRRDQAAEAVYRQILPLPRDGAWGAYGLMRLYLKQRRPELAKLYAPAVAAERGFDEPVRRQARQLLAR